MKINGNIRAMKVVMEMLEDVWIKNKHLTLGEIFDIMELDISKDAMDLETQLGNIIYKEK